MILNRAKIPLSPKSVFSSLSLARQETAYKSFASIIDQCIISLTTFISGLIIARSCTKEEFGLYALGFSIIIFILTIQNSIISSPYMIFGSRFHGNRLKAYTGSTLIQQMAFCFISFCLLYFGGLLISDVAPYGLDLIFRDIGLIISFILLKEFIRIFFLTKLLIKSVLALDLIVSFLQIGALLSFSHLNILTPQIAYWVIGLACGIASAMWALKIVRSLSLIHSEIVFDSKRNIGFGKWYFFSNITILMIAQLNLWLLAMYHGTAAAAILAACQGVINLSNPFQLGIKNILGPVMVRILDYKGIKRLSQMVKNASIFIFAIMGLFCVIIYFFGGHLVTLLYGSGYSSTKHLVFLLSISSFLLALSIAYHCGLMAIERPDLNFKADLFASFVTLCGLLLVKYFGMLGVSINLIIGASLSTLWRSTIFRKNIREICKPTIY